MDSQIELDQKCQELIDDIRHIKNINIINKFGNKLIQVKAKNTDLKSIMIKPDCYWFLYKDNEDNTYYSCIYKNTIIEIDNLIKKLEQGEKL